MLESYHKLQQKPKTVPEFKNALQIILSALPGFKTSQVCLFGRHLPYLCYAGYVSTEKLIVQKWLLPAINHQTINDQFTFRSTGSTTCALAFLCIMPLNYLKQILAFVVYLLIFCQGLSYR